MGWLFAIPVGVLILLVLFEYRIRQPDQIVVYESQGEILQRAGSFFPRHFSLSLPATVQSLSMEVPTEAKGRVGLMVRLTASVAADPEQLEQIIRIGGWDSQAVARAAEELRIAIQGLVREYSEQHEVESITSAGLTHQLEQQLPGYAQRLGLALISVITRAVDPADPEIVETLREREEARIRERTEQVNQHARVAAAQGRLQADAEIAAAEHALALKKTDLRKKQEAQQAALERMRVQEELDRRRMQLEVDREEIQLVAQNPQLLVLTPQVARLAEASQSLRNARTVVSLAGDDLPEGSSVLQMLLSLLQGGGRGQTSDSGAGVAPSEREESG